MFKAISVVSTFSIFIPLLALVGFRRRFLGYKAILVFIACSAGFEMLLFVLNSLKVVNMPFFHLYTLVEWTCLCFYFRTVLDRRYRATLDTLAILMGVYLLVNPLLFEPLYTYNSIARSIESIVLTFFCIVYFYSIYREESVMYLDEQPAFWIVTGLTVYLTVGLCSHLLARHILAGSVDRDTLMTSYAFVQVSNTVKNLLIAFGVWKLNR